MLYNAVEKGREGKEAGVQHVHRSLATPDVDYCRDRMFGPTLFSWYDSKLLSKWHLNNS